jgi:hypothetical protein
MPAIRLSTAFERQRFAGWWLTLGELLLRQVSQHKVGSRLHRVEQSATPHDP